VEESVSGVGEVGVSVGEVGVFFIFEEESVSGVGEVGVSVGEVGVSVGEVGVGVFFIFEVEGGTTVAEVGVSSVAEVWVFFIFVEEVSSGSVGVSVGEVGVGVFFSFVEEDSSVGVGEVGIGVAGTGVIVRGIFEADDVDGVGVGDGGGPIIGSANRDPEMLTAFVSMLFRISKTADCSV